MYVSVGECWMEPGLRQFRSSMRGQHLGDMPGDHGFFIGMHHPSGDRAIGYRYPGAIAMVGDYIGLYPKPGQLRQHRGAQGGRILANPAREDDRVNPAHCSSQFSGMLHDLFNEMGNGLRRRRLALRFERAHVA